MLYPILARILLAIAVLESASGACADPCRDSTKTLGFSDPTIKVTAYEDCTNPDVAYIVPQELNIQASSFSGKKAFTFRELPSGEGEVLMRLNLFVDRSRLTRAVIDLRRNLGRPFQFKPFAIRSLNLQGFSASDGVISQQIVATTADSNAYFGIVLHLNAGGVALWKQAATDDFYSFQAATLSFEMEFGDASGGVTWVKEAREIFLEGLPSCEILNNCTQSDRTARLIDRGKAFGRYYVHTQFLHCRDLLDNTLIAPSVDELEDDQLSDAEREVVRLAAVEAFHAEESALGADCAVENERTRGSRWLDAFLQDKNIICASIAQWPFSRVSTYASSATDAFRDGARAELAAATGKCAQPTTSSSSCDERQGASCGGILHDHTGLCVSGHDVTKLAPTANSSCRLHVYEDLSSGSASAFSGDLGIVARIHGPNVDAQTAKLTGMCVNFNGTSSERLAYRTVIVCE